MTVPVLLDRKQDIRIVRGSALRLILKIKRPDGSLADLTGKQFLWRVFDPTSETHLEIEAAGVGSEAVFLMTGDMSAPLLAEDLMYQVDELVESGFAPWLRGAFITLFGPGAAAGYGAPTDTTAEVSENNGAVVVTSQGAPGLTPWEAAGQTFAEYDAGIRAPALAAAVIVTAQAGDAITELGEFTSVRSAEIDVAITRAEEAAAAIEGAVVPPRTVTTNTLAGCNETITADTTGAPFTITLPAAGGTVTIRMPEALVTATLTVDGNGRTIEGAATLNSADWAGFSLAFTSLGNTWSYAAQYIYGNQA
jgi:hypothetical protein